MDKICNLNKFLKMLCRVVFACFFTIMFFGTDFQNKYNAYVLVFCIYIAHRMNVKDKRKTYRVQTLGCFSSKPNLPALAGSG